MDTKVSDCAIIFEGGGMRGAYSAGFVKVLIENNIYFDFASGVSAGCSLLCNYLSKDIRRNKECFVDAVQDKRIGGIKSLIKGEGFFNSKWLYEQAPFQNDTLKGFDYNTFMENTKDFSISAFRLKDSKLVTWHKKDIKSDKDLLLKVRASSTLPILMPKTLVDGDYYVDGGIVNGITLEQAMNAGYKKFLVIRTNEKDYVRKPLTKKRERLLKMMYKEYPEMIEAIRGRSKAYNDTVEKIKEMEKTGQAYTFYPKKMPLKNTTLNADELAQGYEAGYKQGLEELPAIKAFLNIS